MDSVLAQTSFRLLSRDFLVPGIYTRVRVQNFGGHLGNVLVRISYNSSGGSKIFQRGASI